MIVTEQLEETKRQIEYLHSVLKNEMEGWERKEYHGLLIDALIKKEHLEMVIKKYQSLFN
jgi:hypothetical protein